MYSTRTSLLRNPTFLSSMTSTTSAWTALPQSIANTTPKKPKSRQHKRRHNMPNSTVIAPKKVISSELLDNKLSFNAMSNPGSTSVYRTMTSQPPDSKPKESVEALNNEGSTDTIRMSRWNAINSSKVLPDDAETESMPSPFRESKMASPIDANSESTPSSFRKSSSLPYRPAPKTTPTQMQTKAANRLQHERTKYGLPSRKKGMKSPPSNASGGVPNPHERYLAISNTSLKPLPYAQNILVVIDLNGTLLFRPSQYHPKKYVARPFANEFLKYCTDTFKVVIWSSAKPENVREMCRTLVNGGLQDKVVAIWARNMFRLTLTDYNMKVQCYKRLTYLWEDPQVASSHPDYHLGGRWDQTNTVLIDDSLEKARSEPFNLLLVPEYLGASSEVGYVLPQVHDYLNFLATHANISASIRASPFIPFLPMAEKGIPQCPKAT